MRKFRPIDAGSTTESSNMKRLFLAFVVTVGSMGAACVQNPPTTDNGVVLGQDIQIPYEGATHIPTGTPITYENNPPASGPHWPNPAGAGFYTTKVPTEQWVHNLEHGYIVVLYDCRGSCDPDLLEQLRQFAENAPPSTIFNFAKIVVTPYDGLPEGVLITATAWTFQMNLADFDQQKLLDFYNRYQDQGPERAP